MISKSIILAFSFILAINTEYLSDAEKALSIPGTKLSSAIPDYIPIIKGYMTYIDNNEEKKISDQLFERIQELRRKESNLLPLKREPYLDFMAYLPSRREYELSIDEERKINQTLEVLRQIIPSDYCYLRVQIDRKTANQNNRTFLQNLMNANSTNEVGIGGYRDVFHVAFKFDI